jgi:hypothetical protein
MNGSSVDNCQQTQVRFQTTTPSDYSKDVEMTHLGRLKILNSRHIEEMTQQLGCLSPLRSLHKTDCNVVFTGVSL